MRGARKGTPKDETYNYYGDSERQVDIESLEDHGSFRRVLSKDVPKGEVCINGMFAYTIKRKQLKAGHTRTESYIEGKRRLGGRFCAKGYQVDVGGNPPAPTAQFRILRFSRRICLYKMELQSY